MRPFPDLSEPLTDGIVVLRPAAERDIPEVLIAHQDDPMMYASLGMERPPSGAELGRQLEEARAERITGVRLTLTILESGSDECRGQIQVHEVDWDHARAELAIWVAPEARGRGLARRALVLASGWLIDRSGLVRLELLPAPGNHRLIAAAEAAGFRQEGILRDHARQSGGRADRSVLSILQADKARGR